MVMGREEGLALVSAFSCMVEGERYICVCMMCLGELGACEFFL